MEEKQIEIGKLAEYLEALMGVKFHPSHLHTKKGNIFHKITGEFTARHQALQAYEHFCVQSKIWGVKVGGHVDKDHPEEISESEVSTFYQHNPNLIPDINGKFKVGIIFPSEQAIARTYYYLNKDYQDTTQLAVEHHVAVNMATALNEIQENILDEWRAPGTSGWEVYGDNRYHPNVLVHYVKPMIRFYLNEELVLTPNRLPIPFIQELVLQLIGIGITSARHGHLPPEIQAPSKEYIEILPVDAGRIELMYLIANNGNNISIRDINNLKDDMIYTLNNYKSISFIKPDSKLFIALSNYTGNS